MTFSIISFTVTLSIKILSITDLTYTLSIPTLSITILSMKCLTVTLSIPILSITILSITDLTVTPSILKDTKYNDTQQYRLDFYSQHTNILDNDIQHNRLDCDTQYNDTQHDGLTVTLIMLK
jgi:hypothetical protein